MDEIRRNHIVKLISKSGESVEGEVVDYTFDRVTILIFPYFIDLARKINELDILKAKVHTHLGIKEMVSSVITPIDSLNCIVIENSPTVKVEQKRANVRVISDFTFKLQKDDRFYDCECINISAGGVAFKLLNSNLKLGDNVTISYPSKLFQKDILISASIIKEDNNWFVAQYVGLNPRDEDRIVRYVFKTIVKH